MKFPSSYLFLFLFISCSSLSFSQNDKSTERHDFQIYLKQPAKEIKFIWYEKNFMPIQGKLSEDKKSIIMKDYEPGTKVHVKVIYEDGTEDEFVKSPCYIDPVV